MAGYGYQDNKGHFRYVPLIPQQNFQGKQNKQKFHEKLVKHIQDKSASAVEKAKIEKQKRDVEKKVRHDDIVEKIDAMVYNKESPTPEKFHKVQMAVLQSKDILTNDELKTYNIRLKELHTRMVTPPSNGDSN